MAHTLYTQTTTGDDMRDFAKQIKNKVTRKYRRKPPKKTYLDYPIKSSDAEEVERETGESLVFNNVHTRINTLAERLAVVHSIIISTSIIIIYTHYSHYKYLASQPRVMMNLCRGMFCMCFWQVISSGRRRWSRETCSSGWRTWSWTWTWRSTEVCNNYIYRWGSPPLHALLHVSNNNYGKRPLNSAHTCWVQRSDALICNNACKGEGESLGKRLTWIFQYYCHSDLLWAVWYL